MKISKRIIQEQIYETLAAINELKVHAGENFSIERLEKTRKTLETELEKLRSDERKDDVVTFERLGVDRLFCGRVTRVQKFVPHDKNA